MKVTPFAVEQWMDEHETKCEFNIAETCCASVSVKELVELSDAQVDALSLFDVSKKQTYGAIPGDESLRKTIAGLYSARTSEPLPADNVLITPGAIAANFTVLHALTGPGDHVICHYPTYQQLYQVPQTLGAEVDLWKTEHGTNWRLDVEQLRSMAKSNTKLIILKSNPTGAVVQRSTLKAIVDFAKERSITVLCDEVYRPLFHGIGPMDQEFPPSILSMGYGNVVATGSLSKAYSLAGLRTGWIASRNKELIDEFERTRQYTTISVSLIDQAVANFALSQMTIHGLLGRNIKLAREGLAMLEELVKSNSGICSWSKPVAGTTAFVKVQKKGKPVDAVKFCEKLLAETGVLFVPGDLCFGERFAGFVRVGYAQDGDTIKRGLDKVDAFLKSSSFDEVPCSEPAE